MAFGKLTHSTTIEDILKEVSEIDLLSYYLNIRKVPCVINSPIREDRKPSFGLYTKDGNKIHYIDYSNGESGGTFDLLTQYYNITLRDLLSKISEDINAIKKHESNRSIKKTERSGKSKINSSIKDIKCKIRAWKKHDLKYWAKYGISHRWLDFGKVFPISHIIIEYNNGSKGTILADKYAYAYLEKKDNIVSLKIYQPYNKKYKWLNKHDYSVWDMWDNLPPKGEVLIITSSRKDALCIWENVGIPSTSLQAENCIPKASVINELKERFKKIFVLYDNDIKSKENNGQILGNELAKKYDLINIFIPSEYCSKDASDLALNHGRNKVNSVIYNLVRPYLN